MAFSDHFSEVATEYARFRPGYPPELFGELSKLAPARNRAWDCATGNGQAASMLTSHFVEVVATDASMEQLGAATRSPNVHYACSVAEASPLASGSVDLVTVAQALHWFNRPAFYEEVRRVLVPRGLIAAWTYGRMRIAPGIDEAIQRFYSETVGSYWPDERRHVDAEYSSIEFPFSEILLKPMFMEQTARLAQVAGYLRTWSATQRYIAANGADPVDALQEELLPFWGSSSTVRLVRWPLAVRLGYIG